jgi:hypothetical protein
MKGRFAIVTNVEAGSGGRDGSRAFLTPTNELIRLRGDCGGTVPGLSYKFSHKAFADGQAVWSWRPDAGAKRAMMRSASRGRRGGKRARSPGRARSKPSNHRAGKAGCFRLSLWFLPRAFLSARGPRVSVDTRPSLRPLDFGGSYSLQSSGDNGRENAEARLAPRRREMCCLTIEAERTRSDFNLGRAGWRRPRRSGFLDKCTALAERVPRQHHLKHSCFT